MRRPSRAPLPPGFGTIWVTVAVDLIGFGIVLPLLPLYAEDFGAEPFTVGLLVATYSLMQLVFSPLWGRVSDRFGRKPVLIVSLVGSAVGSLLTGLAPSIGVLFLGRVVDGISGGSVSVAQAAATDVAPPEQRARLLGLLGAAFGVGFVAGPALGGLAALGGRSLPFLLAAAIAGVNAVVALRRLPETNPRRTRGSGASPVPPGSRRRSPAPLSRSRSSVSWPSPSSPWWRSAPSRRPSPSSANAGSTSPSPRPGASSPPSGWSSSWCRAG